MLACRGGFRHVRLNRPSPPKKGGPTGQKMSDRSATFSNLRVSVWHAATVKNSVIMQ